MSQASVSLSEKRGYDRAPTCGFDDSKKQGVGHAEQGDGRQGLCVVLG